METSEDQCYPAWIGFRKLSIKECWLWRAAGKDIRRSIGTVEVSLCEILGEFVQVMSWQTRLLRRQNTPKGVKTDYDADW